VPTYEYHCPTCARNFDVVQGFHDDPIETCPTCGSPVRKVFGNVGIVFKGSGFYKTDSRTSGNGTKKSAGAETESHPATSPTSPASDAPAGGGTSSNGTGGKDAGGTGNGTGGAVPAKAGTASGSGSPGSGSPGGGSPSTGGSSAAGSAS